ncbi:peroxisome biogenesis factor 10 [Mortierella alpina]|nr:peroxisome biogenesis factor 10 [Mortierella alpina]
MHFSKRVTGIRYIFNRKLSPGEERSGYEVLGVLIVIQLAIQLFQWRRQRIADAKEMAATSVTLGEKSTIQQPEDKEAEEEEEEELDEVLHSTAQVNNAHFVVSMYSFQPYSLSIPNFTKRLYH